MDRRGLRMSKIIDINDRVPERRRRRKIRTNIKFSVLLTIFLLAILAILYVQSPYSKIQTIQINGANLVEKEEYEKIVGVTEGESMWGFRVKDVLHDLQKNEWVKEATVQRKWLTTVTIEVEEWPRVAYIEQEFNFYPILENGYVLKKAELNEPIDAPLFINFDDETKRKRTVKQLGKLKPEVLALISQINLNATESDPYGIILFMNDGYEVRAEISSFAEKLNYYPSIIAQIEQQEQFEKGIIDIEVGSYFRPYSGEYSEITISEDGQAEDNTEEGDHSDE